MGMRNVPPDRQGTRSGRTWQTNRSTDCGVAPVGCRGANSIGLEAWRSVGPRWTTFPELNLGRDATCGGLCDLFEDRTVF